MSRTGDGLGRCYWLSGRPCAWSAGWSPSPRRARRGCSRGTAVSNPAQALDPDRPARSGRPLGRAAARRDREAFRQDGDWGTQGWCAAGALGGISSGVNMLWTIQRIRALPRCIRAAVCDCLKPKRQWTKGRMVLLDAAPTFGRPRIVPLGGRGSTSAGPSIVQRPPPR
jgi:hypothetical protein